MKDFFILKVLDRFQFIFRKLKIDYLVLRKIVQVKLIMDGRRVPTMINNYKKRNENEDKNYFLSSLWLYALMGLMIIVPFVIMINNIVAQMSIIFGILMFLISSTIIADFSSVLLDIRDKTIISTKPVQSKTISIAKFIHIVHYLFLVTIILAGPGIIAIFIKYLVLYNFVSSILITLLFIGEMILLDLFIVVITTLIYLFILKFFSGEKLKDIINYVQILMMITITIGYQFIGRIYQFRELGKVEFHDKWYQYLIIPIWFGAPFEVFFNNNLSKQYVILSLLVLIVPILTFIIYIKLIPTFEDNLLKLNQSQKTGKYKKNKLRLSNLFIRNKDERIFYQFTYQMMKSERDFKLKVYPSLGLSLIFPFIFLFAYGISIDELPGSKYYLFIYFCAFLLPTAVAMLKYSRSYKGAWIYEVAPIKDINFIYKGALKAFVFKLLLPIYLIESSIFIYLFHIDILLDLIIVFLTMLLILVICFRLVGKGLPFSQSIDNVTNSQGIVFLLLMFIIGVFAGIHGIFSAINNGVYIYLGIMFIVNFFTWKLSFRRRRF
ncbi:hypothetical protein KHQ81_11450 [Mycoplasmatota bacterium]|nr:hypothetical protein KHQ81_11450 [Mycoplasmatota bacterium]